MDRSRAGSGEATGRGWRACWQPCACRRAGSLLVLVCASCVDLLDIPEHPRLADAPAESPLATGADTGASEVSSPTTAAGADEGAREGAPEALTQPGLTLPLTESQGAETPARAEPLDAGLPAPDAALATDAAPAALPCAAPQSLGPNGDCF